MHENENGFTWSGKNPIRKQARLDYFLVTESCFQYVINSSIIPGYRTDHSAILLKLKLQNNERGKGYWKFNNSLLKDKEYIKLVKETINEVKNTYKSKHPDNLNENSDEKMQFDINDQLFLETLMMIIRGNTIKFSSIRKRKNEEKEKRLENEIKILEDQVNKNYLHLNDQTLEEL